MSQYGYGAPAQGNPAYAPQSAQNLQFFPSSYAPGDVSGHATPSQAAYGYGAPPPGPGNFGGFGGPAAGVSGRMGEQGGLRTGWIAAFSTEGYEGEPPLLEELGVNFGHIQAKTLAVLNPFRRIDQHLMDDSDLAGPFLFAGLFGFFLLFAGNLHFGYIYGLGVLGSISLHTIISLMTPAEDPIVAEPQTTPYGAAQGGPAPAAHAHANLASELSSTLTYFRSASVLGYCLLPLTVTSLVGIVMPMDTPLGIVMTSAAIMWCTYSASGIFCAVGRMRGMRGLVAYPLALFYVGFGLMSIFSSRGSGNMAKLVNGAAS
ncbi:Protein transport protein yip1 [Cytospora mali]|uniref:Protein YIP n=1 Tax=Cytospora mali TaxID=578113 RepID=A0A194UPK5_CYTMA|nr:Protein transport protein yip1 [Valsa mali var. pyri (nom. inval.)]